MPKAHHILTNFTAGEVSTRIDPRVDFSKYQNACRRLENFIIYPQGGITRRNGTKYIAPAKYDDKKCILFSFVYSTQFAYILEFGEGYVRFFRNSAQILSGGSPYEISSPYQEEDLPGLQAYAQSADVIYITHPSYPPRKLSRFGHANWTLTEADINDGPWLDENDNKELYLKSSATSGIGVSLKCRYENAESDIGTWSGVAAAAIEMFTANTLYSGVQFTASSDLLLNSITINISTQSAAPLNTNAYLYSVNPVDGKPLALLYTSPTVIDVATTGDKTYQFVGYSLTSGTSYWIVFDCAVGDAATRASSVNDVAGYVCDSNNISIVTLDPASPLATDIKIKLTTQVIGDRNIFDVNQVGGYWRLRHSGNSLEHDFSSEDTSSTIMLRGKFTVDLSTRMGNGAGDKWWRGTVTLQKTYNQRTYQDVATFYNDTRQEFIETEGDVYYRLMCDDYTEGECTVSIHQEDHYGVLKATAYVNAHELTCDVIHPPASTDATPFWHEGAWSPYRGYPRSSCFFEDRLWFAGTTHQPATLWASWTGDYQNMMPHSTDDAPLDFPLLSQDNNSILWVLAHSDPDNGFLVIGTSGGEWTLSGANRNEALSSKNVKAIPRTTEGSAQNFRPLRIGASVVFLQRAMRNLVEFAYNVENGMGVADLNALAYHVAKEGIVQTAYQQKPDSILWSVRSDGMLLALTYYRREDVVGWSRCPTRDGDLFESVACIPSSLGTSAGHDQVWLSVARQIGGTTKRYIEKMADNESVTEKEDYIFMDSAYTYDGVSTTSITGLSHLEGCVVSILADGSRQPNKTVIGGGITLSRAAMKAQIGPHKASLVKPMRLEAGIAEGTAQARRKRINKIAMRFENTITGKYGASESDLLDIPFRTFSDPMDASAPLFSEDVILLFPGGWETNGDIIITQDAPLPMTLLCIMPTVSVNE